MKKGMAIALGAVGVVAAGWVGAAWYTGTQIEGKIDQYVANINQHFATEVPVVSLRVERRDFSRGVFTSRVRYALVMERTGMLPPEFPSGEIEFDTHIEHGPLPWSRLARGALAPRMAVSRSELVKTDNLAAVFKLTDGVPLYSDDLAMHYDGSFEGEVRVAAVRYHDDAKGIVVEFSGLNLDVQGRGLLSQAAAQVQGKAASLRIDTTPQNHVLLSDITLENDTKMGKFGGGIGDFGVKVGRLEITDSTRDMVVTLDGLGYRVAVSETDTALSIAGSYGLDKLTATDGSGSVRLDFGGGEIAVRMENLDGAAVQELQQALQGMMAGVKAMKHPQDKDALMFPMTTEVVPRLMKGAQKLLAAKPVLTLAPRWHTDAGESTLTLRLVLMAPENLVAMLTPPNRPSDDLLFQLIESIDVDVSVYKPMVAGVMAQISAAERNIPMETALTLAEQEFGLMANMAEMFNLARNDGDKLVGEFRYANRVARLNGVEIPLQQYLPDLADLAGAGGLFDGDEDDGFDEDHDDDDHDHDDDDDDEDDDHDHG